MNIRLQWIIARINGNSNRLQQVTLSKSVSIHLFLAVTYYLSCYLWHASADFQYLKRGTRYSAAESLVADAVKRNRKETYVCLMYIFNLIKRAPNGLSEMLAESLVKSGAC